MNILHDSRDKGHREPFGAAETGTKVSLAIDVSDPAPARVRLMVWKNEELSPQYHDMTEEAAGTGRFRADFETPAEGCLLWYAFEITTEAEDGTGTVYYGKKGGSFDGTGELYEASPECYQITVYRTSEVPAWYTGGIVYQIFPDRFARDEGWRERTETANKKVNDRRSDTKRVIQEDWDGQAYYVRDEGGRVTEWPMYGGSLKGIEEKLGYLKSLGVSCIYLNPVFEASSNHRYDTGDYMHIDPALGTDEDFESLAKAARGLGIRIILDGVFSHTGSDSKYFDKFGNYSQMRPEDAGEGAAAGGAWQNEDSSYRSWYKFDDNEKYGYKSWWGVEDLPEVDENDPGYREFILGEDGVAAHWLRKGASGWRLDVADELPDSFIADIRKRIKETDPDAVLMGEVWEDASNKISYGERRKYFLGEELDCTMHYPLRDILLDYINYTISSPEAACRLMTIAENYPRPNLYAALNLIGSHDRERIMTLMAGGEDPVSAQRKVKILSALQYCLPGVPCIYYGDEAGLMGGRDPENRSAYPWGHEDLDLEYHYRMLGLVYDEHPALKDGDFRFISGMGGLSDDIFAFTRSGRDAGGAEETVLVLANRSYGPAVADLSGIEGLDCGYALELLTSEELQPAEDGSPGIIEMERLSVKVISLRKERPRQEDLGRDCGVICHLGSIPGGRLGKGAKDFVDYLASAGFGIWQLLPLNPAGLGESPYSSYASFAGEPAFIDPDDHPDLEGFEEFVQNNYYWLFDYIAFILLKEANCGKHWYEWPQEHRDASTMDILDSLSEDLQRRASGLAYQQYQFFVQWNELKAYANSKGIRLMGDLPVYMAPDSADVWANRKIFRIDSRGAQKVHAGVPPDAFSNEGQDWGNPLYDWDALKADGYGWWLRRVRQCAERYDILRIDHFRGFSEYYAIPEGGDPADGSWQHSGGLGFIAAVRRMLDEEGLGLKLLAEDLGYQDAGAKNLMKLSVLPGMDIWQFSAEKMMEMCREEPEKAERRAFYTGTHDNNTLMGDIREKAARQQKEEENGEGAASAISDIAMSVEALSAIGKIYQSPASLAMMQLQDVFLLGEEARMNVPGTVGQNWKWKVTGASVEDAFPGAAARARWLKDLAQKTGRCDE